MGSTTLAKGELAEGDFLRVGDVDIEVRPSSVELLSC